MITKDMLLDALGGNNTEAAKRLGYTGYRADNNINRLPPVLTKRQLNIILLRMRAERIEIPKSWKKYL